MFRNHWLHLLAVVWLALYAHVASGLDMGIPQIQYQSREDFVAAAFRGQKPDWKMMRLKAPVRKRAEAMLGHQFPGGRLRYWVSGTRTAWIIDEVGKEQPITIGIVVNDDQIEQVKILVYREERGGEVHEDFFTHQFHQATLDASDHLSKPIDGITGATLSVNAVTRVARWALAMHQVALEKAAQ